MHYGIWPKILLIGKNGQVGWELERSMAPLGEVIALDYPEIDLGNPDTIIETIRFIKPDLIVNAAAYTAVDKAEDEPDLAMAINGTAPGIIAEEAKRTGALLVHFSTDYVFDGMKDTPYTEEDEPNPLNVYGMTKLAGDRAIQAVGTSHLIFRTSWVYGLRGKNFLLTMLRLAQESDEIRVVDDQIGAPTWCRMIATATVSALAQDKRKIIEKSGLYNMTAGGATTWYGFADYIFRRLSPATVLCPITAEDYSASVRRPSYSILATNKLVSNFGVKMDAWDHALNQALCA